MQGCIVLLIYMQTPVINMQIKHMKYPIVSKLAKEAWAVNELLHDEEANFFSLLIKTNNPLDYKM